MGGAASAYHGTLAVADQTEVQVLSNTSGIGVGGVVPSVNLATIPTIDLTLDSGRTRISLHYAPLLTLRALEARLTPDALNQGAAGIVWHTQRTEVALLEYATYGATNYASPTAAPPGTSTTALQALPVNTVLTTGASRSTLALTRYITRRLFTTLAGGYALSGGADEASRAILPLQRGPFGQARVEGAVTRQDRLVAAVDYDHLDFSATPCTGAPTTYGVASFATCAPTADRAEASVGVRHKISQATELLVQGGASGIALRPSAGAPTGVKAYPLASATLTSSTHQLSSQTTLSLALRLSPVIAQQTGAVDQRAAADAGVDWTAHKLTLHGLLRASQSVPATTPGTYFDGFGEIGGAYRVSRNLSLAAGQRLDYQRIVAGPNVLASFSYARVEVTAPPVKF